MTIKYLASVGMPLAELNICSTLKGRNVETEDFASACFGVIVSHFSG